jgi:hypothetical protein
MAIAASTGVLASLTSFTSNDGINAKPPVQQASPIAKLQQQDNANLQAANDQKNTLPGTPNVNAPRGSYVNFVV